MPSTQTSPNPTADRPTMAAIVQTEYGGPEVLSLQAIPKPTVTPAQVLVRVRAASVNAGDWHLMRGTPFLVRLIFGGLFRPSIPILGSDMAGEVAAIGAEIDQFTPGDAVLGDLSDYGFGAFAEYVAVPPQALALKPEALTFEAAAALPGAALAALQALRDGGNLQPGQRVLINGASGGVGSFAVQLAKAWGAEVTGVCRTNKMEMVRSLGADQVFDSSQGDITQQGQTYDVIIDAAAYRSARDYWPILASGGTYVLVGGSTRRFLQGALLGGFIARGSDKKLKVLEVKANPEDLALVRDLAAKGQIRARIDRQFPLAEVPAAIRHLEQRQVQGKVVVQV